jgi:L-lysine exporter family protein LysE/ArgO
VNVAALRAGVQAGSSRSFALGVGSCFGDLLYAAIAMGGVTAILSLPLARWLLWIGGSGVLVYLAWTMLREGWRGGELIEASGSEAADQGSLWSYFLQGIGLALASPSSILWFASVGGAVIATLGDGAKGAVWLFFAGFFLSGLVWSAFVALVAGQGRRFGTGFVRGFRFGSAVLFAGLAAKVFVDGYRFFMGG